MQDLSPAVDLLAYRWQLTQSWRAFHATSPGSHPGQAGAWRHVGYYPEFVERGLLLPALQQPRTAARAERFAAYRRGPVAPALQLDLFTP